MSAVAWSRRKIIWKNLIFFAVTTAGAVVFAPIYAGRRGFDAWDAAFFLFYVAATGLAITVGYHRLYSHRTFKAHPAVELAVLFFGAAAFEQSALEWSSQHRDHHRFVDTERDPYNIKRGFFYAHMGWLLFWEHRRDHSNVEDLRANRLLMHQHRYYVWWAVTAGILVPALAGWTAGRLEAALLLTVCVRLTLVYHSTFAINSVCHTFGKATYDRDSTAKDHWIVALLTNGEGYHNFHHKFPYDFRNGIRWYHWDPSKWTILALSRLRLASGLVRAPEERIREAREHAASPKPAAVFDFVSPRA